MRDSPAHRRALMIQEIEALEESVADLVESLDAETVKRLNTLLGQHGIEVTSIVTPRPRFSKEYEDLIESRNQTENQLAVIDSELARAKTERDRKLAEVERDQNKIIQTKRAELYAEVMRNLIEDVPFVPLWQVKFQYGHSAGTENVIIHPGWLFLTHLLTPA